jgi:hypothetical protein
MGVECPVCRCGTVEFVDEEVRCRGECGTIWKRPRWESEMRARKSLASYEETAEKGGNLDEKLHLTLRLDVTYDPNGVKKEWLEAALHDVVKYAMSNGMLTGPSEAEVDEWSANVSETKEGALIHDVNAGDGADYTLKDDHNSCWITVGDLSVYVHRGGDPGVIVDIYGHGGEMEEPLASCYAFESEAHEMCEECGEIMDICPVCLAQSCHKCAPDACSRCNHDRDPETKKFLKKP